MVLNGYAIYSEEVIINPMTEEEIEILLQSEKNPLVAQALRDEYAAKKKTYYYNSSEDENFVREGVDEYDKAEGSRRLLGLS